MDKQKALEKIWKEIKNSQEFQVGVDKKVVLGEGNPQAKVVFVGEAPGRQEIKEGRPFIGRAGKLLREQIKAIGLDEKNIYITNSVKYLPFSGTPKKNDIERGRTFVKKELEIINPELVILLGKTSLDSILNDKSIMVSKVHGKIIKKDDRKYFVSFHPSAAIRFQKLKKEFIKDFQKLKKFCR